MEKNKIWLWRAARGITRQPLGWEFGHRGDSTLRKLLDKLNTKTCVFLTDEWPGFFRLLPEDRHFYGKDLTFPIEQTNSDIRDLHDLLEGPNLPQGHWPWFTLLLLSTIIFKSRIIFKLSSQPL